MKRNVRTSLAVARRGPNMAKVRVFVFVFFIENTDLSLEQYNVRLV